MTTILGVDDDWLIRNVLQRVLGSAGYEVEVAADGTEALKRCAAQRFDLVLTDVYMPNRDGFELIKELKKTTRDARVVAMSSGVLEGIDVLFIAKALGCVATLQKPFGAQELLDTVKTALTAES
jgi:CheY-like chemotaxis protein